MELTFIPISDWDIKTISDKGKTKSGRNSNHEIFILDEKIDLSSQSEFEYRKKNTKELLCLTSNVIAFAGSVQV